MRRICFAYDMTESDYWRGGGAGGTVGGARAGTYVRTYVRTYQRGNRSYCIPVGSFSRRRRLETTVNSTVLTRCRTTGSGYTVPDPFQDRSLVLAQTTQIPSSLPSKRDCSTKRVNEMVPVLPGVLTVFTGKVAVLRETLTVLLELFVVPRIRG